MIKCPSYSRSPLHQPWSLDRRSTIDKVSQLIPVSPTLALVPGQKINNWWSVPVIPGLPYTSPGSWTEYQQLIKCPSYIQSLLHQPWPLDRRSTNDKVCRLSPVFSAPALAPGQKTENRQMIKCPSYLLCQPCPHPDYNAHNKMCSALFACSYLTLGQHLAAITKVDYRITHLGVWGRGGMG